MALKTPKEQALSDLEQYFDADMIGAENATYTFFATGAQSEIVVIILYNQNPDQPSQRAGVRAHAVIQVKTADVPAPEYKDTVLIAEQLWKVIKVVRGSAFLWEIEAESNTALKLG